MLIKHKLLLSAFIFLTAIAFIAVDWSLDGFEFFKAQKYEYYFQSWVSLAGLIFSATIAVTTFIIYKKTKKESLKWISLSFLLTTLSYIPIGYHASYCQVCSDLSMCSASHNYSNYITVMALITLVLSVLFIDLKKNVVMLKLFSYGLIIASFLMMLILSISMQFMELPTMMPYEIIDITDINLQGFVFVIPLILVVLSFIYFKRVSKITNSILFVFFLLFLSFVSQAYHVFLCNECHIIECSEFYVFSGLFMISAVGLVIYAISKQLEEQGI